MSTQFDVLFISPDFFGYAAEITKKLESRGHRVAYYDNRPARDSRTKALLRIAPSLVAAKSQEYFEAIIASLRDHPIKHVFVIKGEALSPACVRRMRGAFPGAKFTMYFWDSFGNMPADSREKAALFDRVFTFDPKDAAATPGLTYRPLFFLDSYARAKSVAEDVDVLFIGTAHSDRYSVLKRIENALPPNIRFQKRLYFPAEWLYSISCLRHWDLVADRKCVIFKPMSKAEIRALVERSRVIVDIERAVQSGYTIRTLEMLAAGKKLITTNPEVARADFYDPQNVLVVDRKLPQVPLAFLSSPYAPPPPNIVKRYSLDHWLDEVLPQSVYERHS